MTKEGFTRTHLHVDIHTYLRIYYIHTFFILCSYCIACLETVIEIH